MKAVCTRYKLWGRFCSFDSWPLYYLVKEPDTMSKIWILTKFAQSSNCDGFSAGYRLNQLQRMISSVRCEWKRMEKKELFLLRLVVVERDEISVISNVPLFSWQNVFLCNLRKMSTWDNCSKTTSILINLTLPYHLLGCWWKMEMDYKLKEKIF